MTPLVAVASLCFAVAVYAWIGFWRFESIDMNTLADYELSPKPETSVSGVAAITGVLVWGAVIFALGYLGYSDLQGLVWAGSAIGVLLALTLKSFLPSRCETCAGPVRFFRKQLRVPTPAIVHVKVCDHCKTYREDLVIGLGKG